MNLVDAIKSGRPFRRSTAGFKDHVWLRRASRGDFAEWTDLGPKSSNQIKFTPEEVLADDWEVQEVTAQISSRQYWAAVTAVRGRIPSRPDTLSISLNSFHIFVDELARKLGLENE